MLVYRVEDFDGQGPYQISPLVYAQLETFMGLPSFLDDDPVDHPHPYQDGFNTEGLPIWEFKIPQEYSFGFRSSEDLRKWFFREETDAQRLEEVGLRVRVFSVSSEHVLAGNSQVMFRKYLAKLLEDHGPIEYAGNNFKK